MFIILLVVVVVTEKLKTNQKVQCLSNWSLQIVHAN